MPYTTESKYTAGSMTCGTYWPGGQQQYVFENNVCDTKFFSRSGTNLNGRVKPPKHKPSKPAYELVLTPIEKTVKRRRWNRVEKRWVTYQEKIVVYRMRPKPPKKGQGKRPKTGFQPGMKPNALSYRGETIEKVTTGELVAAGSGGYNQGWTRRISGVIGNYSSYWSSGGAPHPNSWQYSSGTIATRYASQIADLQKAGLSGIYAKVKNQSINLAQALVEARMTISMIGQLATRIATTMIAMKRGQFKKAAETLLPTGAKQLANDRLLYTYGISPLLSDVKGAAEHLADYFFDIRAIKVRTMRNQSVESSTNWSDSSVCKGSGTVTVNASIRVKYTVEVAVSNRVLEQVGRLGFTNPASLAWEVIPYSFVADWFIPIGNYLNSLDAFQGLAVLSFVRSTSVTEEIVFEGTVGGADNYGWTWASQGIGWEKKNVYFEREILSSAPPLPPPEPKNPFSSDHVLNAVALMGQLLKK